MTEHASKREMELRTNYEQLGRKARREGKPRTSNPFMYKSSAALYWEFGYNKENKIIKTNQQRRLKPNGTNNH